MPHQLIKNKQEWIAYLSEGVKTLSDLRVLRKECYSQIETIRKRPLIVYASNFINVKKGEVSIDLSDIEGFTDLVGSIADGNSVDVLIHSPGGYPDATERIVSILRNKFEEVHFLVPHSAYSAATMLCLSGDTVTLHPSATLGPIDPQFNGVPARSIKRGFENIKEKIRQEGPESLPAYMPLIEKYSIDLLEQCDDSLNLSKTLVTSWLHDYMLRGQKDVDIRIEEVVEFFSNYDEHLTHSRPLVFSKIKKFDLKVSVAQDQLADLMWEAFLLMDGFFMNSNFIKIFENSQDISWGRQGPMNFQLPIQFPQQEAHVPAQVIPHLSTH